MNTTNPNVSGTMGSVPNKPKTKIRGVRIDDELWESAQAVAADNNETVSDMVRRDLERDVKAHARKKAKA